MSEPYLYAVGDVLLLGIVHISPLWSIPADFLSLITSQDKLYLENDRNVRINYPPEEPKAISYYSYAISGIKTIEDLSWFEHLSVKTQNILAYFVPLDAIPGLSMIEAKIRVYVSLQQSCSQTYPYPYGYEGMDMDLAAQYYDRSGGLESSQDVISILEKSDIEEMESLPELCISNVLKARDLVASCFNKNTQAILKIINERGGLEDLLDDHTLNWMEKINAIITSGERAVIAVGVGHLFGENGILYQLLKTGYQVLSLKRDEVTKTIISEYMSISEMLAGEISEDIESEAGLLGISDAACVSAE